VNNDAEQADYFKSHAFATELHDEGCAYPKHVAIQNPRYELLSKKPECFSLVFDVDVIPFVIIREKMLAFLVHKFELSREEITIENMGLFYKYHRFKDNKDISVFMIPNNPIESKKFHMTLLSSFDFKRFNKSEFKSYHEKTDASDRLKYLEDKFGGEKLESIIYLELNPVPAMSFK
jgi:hypothetical protein